jgi:phosphate transport system permease protein
MLRSWPRVSSALMALVPVAMLVFMVVTIVVRSAPAFTDLGLGELFSTDFANTRISGRSAHGLTPALWGSLEVLVIAMTLAIPASLAIAVCAGELAPGVVGKVLRVAIGFMSGIPPIVYALMAIVFVAPLMIPKFTGNLSYSNVDPTRVGVPAGSWPPTGVPWNAGAFAWNPSGESNSVLLAGILLAMLAIPFMAPLIEDTIRNVPHDPKEASLALGASRGYTLMHVTLPQSMAGIISGIRLGSLKVLGDVMIGMFVIGTYAAMPNPVWDVLERTGPLTAVGAGLVGGFQAESTGCNSADCAAGYFSGLLLLVGAFVIVVVTVLLERYFRRRVAV